MKLNEFAHEVHENAVAHGWYDTAPSLPEVIASIHAELSEALEEYREGNPLIYGTCALAAEDCKYSGMCDRVGRPDADGAVEGPCKPEGVAVELCDAVLRILDTLDYYGVDIEKTLEAKHAYNIGREYRHGGKII